MIVFVHRDGVAVAAATSRKKNCFYRQTAARMAPVRAVRRDMVVMGLVAPVSTNPRAFMRLEAGPGIPGVLRLVFGEAE
jgi:hypothetical protein